MFKTVYRRNIENYAHDQETAGKSTSLSAVYVVIFIVASIQRQTKNMKLYLKLVLINPPTFRNGKRLVRLHSQNKFLDDELVCHDSAGNNEDDPMSAHL